MIDLSNPKKKPITLIKNAMNKLLLSQDIRWVDSGIQLTE